MTEKLHAKYSASGSHRWLACPGSVALSEKAPPQIESEYAKEGTLAHACLDEIFRARFPRMRASQMIERNEYPTEMVQHCLECFNWVKKEKPKNAKISTEQKLVVPGVGFGTTDIIVETKDFLWVIDFKYGMGVVVDPEENSQMIYYALGKLLTLIQKPKKVRLSIYQPRAFHENGISRHWDTTAEVILSWFKKLKDGVTDCEDPLAPLNAGDHCQFCPAKVICPEISEKALAEAQIDFDVICDEPKEVLKHLSPVQLSTALKSCMNLEIWIEAIREHAFERMRLGTQIKGFKLVDKRATRKWVNLEKVQKEAKSNFGDMAFTVPELLSPAQLEKISGKQWVNERTSSISSGLTLVPESDRRSAVNPVDNDFEVIETPSVQTNSTNSKEKKNGKTSNTSR